MSNIIEKGMIFKTNSCGECTVIEYENFKNIKVMFSDGTVVKCRGDHLRTGTVKNPNVPSVLGIGYLGVGEHLASVDGRNTRLYQKWINMLTRCYCEKQRHKNKTYEQCTVAEEWFSFQNFAEWASKQAGCDQPGWQLDKDILVLGNKIYSPETCCFVPSQINNLFTHIKSEGNVFTGVSFAKDRKKYRVYCNDGFGTNHRLGSFNTKEEAFKVYKDFKESIIKNAAYMWKGVISDEVFDALMAYEVRHRG